MLISGARPDHQSESIGLLISHCKNFRYLKMSRVVFWGVWNLEVLSQKMAGLNLAGLV